MHLSDGSLKFLTFTFLVICSIGLMWQVFLIGELYFAYKVTSSINIKIPEMIEPVGTTYCTRFTDILDFERLNSDTKRTWFYSFTGSDIQKYQDELTVAEIFTYTPAENDTLVEVVFRNNDSYDRMTYHGNDVYQYVDVLKYVYLEHVCYRFGIKNASTMPYGYYAVTPTSPGMMYEIILSDSLSRSDPIKISMHEQTILPYRSLMVEPVIWRQYEEKTKTAKYSTFQSFQERLVTTLLPSPYVTHCFDYTPKFASEAHCVQSCLMQKSLKQLEMAPFSVLITDPTIDKTMVSLIDLKNDSLVVQLMGIERECREHSCPKKHCEMRLSMTTTESFVAPKLKLKMVIPSHPWITVTSSPALEIVEFLTYVMGTIATWTGASALTFMPNKVIRFKRMFSRTSRRKSHCRHISRPNTGSALLFE